MLATYTVNVEYDALAPFDLNDPDVTLREAVFLAEQDDDPDIINFDSSLDGKTITLGIDESGNPIQQLQGFAGDLDITESVTIDAQGQDITIDASGTDTTPGVDDGAGSRIFFVEFVSGNVADKRLVLDGLTLTGGDSLGNGGAIQFLATLSEQTLADPLLTLRNSWVTGNHAAG